MATTKTVWGIDVGQCALKAIKLRSAGGTVRAEAFDVIEHPKILSQPDADRDRIIANTLEQFLARNNVAGSVVAVSAPGQSGFTRFVKLPPVEPKQVPEIVRFEAEQQIPFNINDVIWRWQTFLDPDSPDVEVGIFAMKRADITGMLDRFGAVGVNVDIVQMAPLALYNFMLADGQVAAEGATLLIDVGTDKSELVVADGPRIWTRTLQLGGNNFTEALVKAFKLSFAKAERLKRTAATSKYARQVFQAMRPVFAELVQEVQRSVGFYTSLHRDSRFQRVLGLGNGFRLPGLQKFLEQNLSVPVTRLDAYELLAPSPAVNAPAFTENVLSFAVSYGLALQGLGMTKVLSNLLPAEIASRRRWRKKQPWFAVAAAIVLGAISLYTLRANADHGVLARSDSEAKLEQIDRRIRIAGAPRAEADRLRPRIEEIRNGMFKYDEMLAYRNLWPAMHSAVNRAIADVAADQKLLTLTGRNELMDIPREDRRTVSITRMYSVYEADVSGLTDQDIEFRHDRGGRGGRGGRTGPHEMLGRSYLPGSKAPVAAGTPYAGGEADEETEMPAAIRGYLLYLEGTTPLSRNVSGFISSLMNQLEKVVAMKVRRSGKEVRMYPYFAVKAARVVDVKRGGTTGAGPDGMDMGRGESDVDWSKLDPLTGESREMDTTFVIGWVISIEDDGLAKTGTGAAGGGTGGAR